jgi:DnaK suppressor protein
MPLKKPAAKSGKAKKPAPKKAPAPKRKSPPARAAAKPARTPVPAPKPAPKSSRPAPKAPAKAVRKAAAPLAAKAPAQAKVPATAKASAQAKGTSASSKAIVAPAKSVAAPAKGVATPMKATMAPAKASMAPAKHAAPAATARPRPTGPVAVAVASSEPRRYVPVMASDDEEGGDAASAHNLLLGPKNVKPYVLKKGEQYMNKEQLEHFRSILSSWKRDLMEEVDRTMVHMKDEAANPPDPNDRATLESEFALELRTRDRERKLIRKIDEALKRIDDGSYGYCNETGEPIGIKRLEARPVATLCIEAQERRERREKQYGDRDDWYR